MSLEQKIEELTKAVTSLNITLQTLKFPEAAKYTGQMPAAVYEGEETQVFNKAALAEIQEYVAKEEQESKPAAKGKTKTAAASADSAGSTSAKETSAPSQEHPGAQTGKAVTVEELRAAAAAAAKKDRAATMTAVNKYAPGVSQVAEEDRPALLKELEKINV